MPRPTLLRREQVPLLAQAQASEGSDRRVEAVESGACEV